MAAGDPELDRLIVNDAFPGWQPVPTILLEQTVASERTAVGAATNHTFHVADEGWRQGVKSLFIVLISFPNGDPPSDFKARDAVIGACGASTRSAPRSMQPYLGITGATEASCVGTNAAGDPVNAAVMSWQQQNIFALAIGNEFSTAELEQFAVQQDAALSRSRSGSSADSVPSIDRPASSSSSSSSNTELLIIVGVVIAVGGAIVFLLIARSRSRMPAPIQALSVPAGTAGPSTFAPPTAAARYAPPVVPDPAPVPGWQPVNGDPTRIAYWDGTQFTAWKRWDGAGWVD